MAKFTYYKNPSAKGYLLDVQADLLSSLNTRLVVPLMTREIAPLPAARLNPVFVIESEPYVMVTQFMAAVPIPLLKEPSGTLEAKADDISNALDMLLYGF